MKRVAFIVVGLLLAINGILHTVSWTQSSRAFRNLATAVTVHEQRTFEQRPEVQRAFKAAGYDPDVTETSAADAAEMAQRISQVIFRNQALGGVGTLVGIGLIVVGIVSKGKAPQHSP